MFSFLVFSVLCVGCLANTAYEESSASEPVGSTGDVTFATAMGCITGIRVSEIDNSFINGLQVRLDETWGDVFGTMTDKVQELLLFDGENIVQISGKYDPYINSLEIVTSEGRSLIAGQPSKISFNMYPLKQGKVLIQLTGSINTADNAISQISAKWGGPADTTMN